MIVLTVGRNARIFTASGNSLLPVDDQITAGTELEFGAPKAMRHDHRVRLALPFMFERITYWLLAGEMGLTDRDIDEIAVKWVATDPAEVELVTELRNHEMPRVPV